MKRLFLILLLVLILGGGYIFREKILEKIENFYHSLILKLPEITFEIPKIETLIKEPQVFTPPPLKIESEEVGNLTNEGIIKWTNLEREKYGLPPLKENNLLNQSANLKLKDMLEKQYFDHISPEGVKLNDLVEKVNYQFIGIGENLAMGNFRDDEDLVSSWMESQGHRENILNEKFQEIGVAVEQGFFDGKKVWIAVQHFGKPLSACPLPNEQLKTKIENNKEKLEELEKLLTNLELEIKKTRPRFTEDLKEKIKEYNNLVDQYNALAKETQALINQYNTQVESFNACLSQ